MLVRSTAILLHLVSCHDSLPVAPDINFAAVECCCCATGDVGLEIAPGNDVEDLSLIEDVGNIWNHVPVARTWTRLDPK